MRSWWFFASTLHFLTCSLFSKFSLAPPPPSLQGINCVGRAEPPMDSVTALMNSEFCYWICSDYCLGQKERHLELGTEDSKMSKYSRFHQFHSKSCGVLLKIILLLRIINFIFNVKSFVIPAKGKHSPQLYAR